MESIRSQLTALTTALANADHVVVLTGAGVSAESGVPTFRDAQTGLWSQYKAEDLATPEAFDRDPALVWNWYQARRERVQQVEPNPGHTALAELQRRLPRFTLITQNVDGLHERAGSVDVIEFHGNIHRTVCSARPCPGEWQTDDNREPPVCPECGSHLRPDVVWFGEAIPEDAMHAAVTALHDCDVFIAVGTSSLVYPAAGLATMAASNGAIVAEINPAATPLTSTADICIAAPSGKVLPELVASLSAS